MKNENCDRRLFCDDYKYNHCDGCGANKPKGDLISREALKEAIDKEFEKANLSDYEACSCVCEIYDKCIDNAPTVELQMGRMTNGVIIPIERPQGEWIDEGQYAEGHSEHAYRCKKCGYHIIEKPNMIFENRFCKYCGADMRGGVEHGSNDR